MILQRTPQTGILLLILTAMPGCFNRSAPVPEATTVIAMNGAPLDAAEPVVLDLKEPAAFTLTGLGFGEPGGLAKVVFRTTDGSKPFLGETLGEIQVPGDIRSDTEIVGVLALPGVAVEVRVTVHVEIPDGTVSTQANNAPR